MKFSVKRERFLRGINLSSKSLLSKASLPILSNTYISAVGNKVEVVSTNLEHATKVSIDAVVEKEGTTTILGRALGELVSQFTEEDILFEKIGEEVLVSSGSIKSRFTTMDASEFPAIPKVEEGKTLKIDAKEFSKAVVNVSFCAAQDESRPILTGILCSINKDGLILVATDGYRLGFSKLLVKNEGKEAIDFIVPAKALIEVSKIVSELEYSGELELKISANLSQILIKLDSVEFTSRLIEGEFPNWQKIIPATFSTAAKVNKAELVKVIKIASIFARESGSIVKVLLESEKAGKSSLSVSATTAQVGSTSAKIPIELTGKGGEIAFNYRYLIDVLSVLDEESVVFEMNESLNPGKITPEKRDNLFHVIMPVRLQG